MRLLHLVALHFRSDANRLERREQLAVQLVVLNDYARPVPKNLLHRSASHGWPIHKPQREVLAAKLFEPSFPRSTRQRPRHDQQRVVQERGLPDRCHRANERDHPVL